MRIPPILAASASWGRQSGEPRRRSRPNLRRGHRSGSGHSDEAIRADAWRAARRARGEGHARYLFDRPVQSRFAYGFGGVVLRFAPLQWLNLDLWMREFGAR